MVCFSLVFGIIVLVINMYVDLFNKEIPVSKEYSIQIFYPKNFFKFYINTLKYQKSQLSDSFISGIHVSSIFCCPIVDFHLSFPGKTQKENYIENCSWNFSHNDLCYCMHVRSYKHYLTKQCIEI